MNHQEVSLRKLIPSDRLPLAELANNKKIWNNLRDYFPHPYSIKDAEAFIEMTQKEHPQTTFAISYKNEFVGVVGLIVRTDVYRKTAEIGFWIGEPYWNKGIASHAVKLIVDYGFDKLGLIRIDAGVFKFNGASCSVLKKSGFEQEGIFKKSVIKNNMIVNEVRFAIINKKFTAV